MEISKSLKDIFSQEANNKKEVRVSGWVRSVRESKNLIFVSLNDGSTHLNLQIIFQKEKFLSSELKGINFSSSLVVSGFLLETPEKLQQLELQAREIISIGTNEENYALQKKETSLDTIRNLSHLRIKTNYFSSLFRLRHLISISIHNFFDKNDFFYVHTPIITNSDSEGAGETFKVVSDEESFFDEKKNPSLTVSGQLHAECLAQGLKKVYTFAPCFRAEKSKTTRHLAEFWMVEPEFAFADLESAMQLAEDLIKCVINVVLQEGRENLIFLQKFHGKLTLEKLEKVKTVPFVRRSYDQCVEILANSEKKFKIGSNVIEWGMDFHSEHEKYLCEYFDNMPVFVFNYPKAIKAFYMKENLDKKTVASFDLLVPDIGELVGGSVREDNYKIIEEKVEKIGIDKNNLCWYLELRKRGYGKSAGFGLGLERLIMYISGAENIKDVIAFPCFYKHLNF